MPAYSAVKRKPRKYYKRKRNYRRRLKAPNNWATTRFPMPKKSLVNMRYVEKTFSLNPAAAGVAANYFFSCNGLYDPNITGTGHQPLGFDQFVGNIYDHYVVIGARISLWIRQDDTTHPMIVTLSVDDDTTAFADITNKIEQGTCKWQLIDNAASGREASTTLMTYSVNPNKYLGRTSPLSDPDLKGSDSANPNEQCFFAIGAAPTSTVDATGVTCTAVIDYKVLLIEPRDLASS